MRTRLVEARPEVAAEREERWVLCNGAAAAHVAARGAALRELRVGDRDLVVPVAPTEEPPGLDGAVLLPWPNRVRDGRFTLRGREHQLELTEPERGNAAHGLLHDVPWTSVARTDTLLRLAVDLQPAPGYPWSLHAEVRYELATDGITVTSRTTNAGDEPAPMAIGFHPWISPGRHRLEDCTVQIDAGGWVETDERLLPVTEHDGLPSDLDFTRPRRLGDTVLDTAFVDLPGETPIVRLTDPDGVEVTVWQGPGLGCWQIYTGDGLPGVRRRGALAVEPMSATADALRTGHRLRVLDPGQSHETIHGITVRRGGNGRQQE